MSSLPQRVLVLLALLIAVSAVAAAERRPQPPVSGSTYASTGIRAMQADDMANPGMLWITQGEKLWRGAAGRNAKSCADCHQDAATGMKGVAASYPRVDSGDGQLLNIEARINRCRVRHQDAAPVQYESAELLALTAYVAHQSRGVPVTVAVDERNRAHFERGQETYFRRQGQLNLACTNCHDSNAGKTLLTDTISQGHGNAYPAYRLEWQSAGSLHRRLRACYFGIRAERPASGADELVDLELYLAWRANGLPVETPGVRR